MTTLSEQITNESTRGQVVSECVSLIDTQVRGKSGFSGVAIKGAYGAVKKIKKNFVQEVIDGLLDEWIEAMEPFYDKWKNAGNGGFSEFIGARSDDVAEALLSVTDKRAAKTKHRTAGKAYKKLRGSAHQNVSDAVPGLALVIEKHISDDAASVVN